MSTIKAKAKSPMTEQSDWQVVSIDVLREKYAKGAEQELDGPEMVNAIHGTNRFKN